MRIVTLVSGADALPDSLRLEAEIRSFNAGVDFRLRFLHVEIEPCFALPTDLVASFQAEGGKSSHLEVEGDEPLQWAARLALLLARERPVLLLIVGQGPLRSPGQAAARAHGTRLAYFNGPKEESPGDLELGTDAPAAVDRLTGVAREIH